MEDLTGRRFIKLTVVAYSHSGSYGKHYWLCQCDCGSLKSVEATKLRSGRTRSCGCIRKCGFDTIRYKLYHVWDNIIKRCCSPTDKRYHNYGGRGITVYSGWLRFEPFYEWALSNGYKLGLQLDRKDNNRGYSPDNCRFVTCKVNQNNRRDNRLLKVNGVTKTLSDWAKETGIAKETILYRLNSGYSDQEAVITPKFERRKERSVNV